MADRSRRHGARHAFRVLLLTVAIFVLWRLLGPGVAVVRKGSLAPILENGDIVWITPARGELEQGTIVLVAPFFSSQSGTLADLAPFGRNAVGDETEEPSAPDIESPTMSTPRPDALVPRIVVAFSGDEVTWTDTSVTVVRPDGNRFQLSPDLLHPLLRQRERSVIVPEDSVFAVSLSGGIIDSRLVGPRPESAVHYEVSRIIWPRERRGTIAPVDSGRSASP